MKNQDRWSYRQRGVFLLAGAALAASAVFTTTSQVAAKTKPSSNVKGVSDAQVVEAMVKGIDFLFGTKKGNNWEYWNGGGHGSKNVGGETSLVLYSLIHAGHSLQDQQDETDSKRIARLNPSSPDLAPVVEYLSNNVPDGTYTAGLQASALALAYNEKRDAGRKEGPRAGLEAAKRYLLEAMGPDGGYTYANPRDPKSAGGAAGSLASSKAELEKKMAEAEKKGAAAKAKGDDAEFQKQKEEYERLKASLQQLMDNVNAGFRPIGDLSNAQYGALGAWALSDVNIELPNMYWKVSDRFWHLTQDPSGSWPYSKAAWPHHAGNDNEVKDTMGVAGLATLYITQGFVDEELRLIPRPDKNIERGMAWLDKDFKASNNLYYMYGVERVGLASGRKFFGTTDWYREGAASLVKSQAADGSWKSSYYGADQQNSTAYALLFLARGRLPIVFNKLEYNGYWNARPRDNANITDWMAKYLEKHINWQTVNLRVSPEQWLDAPVLLITGSQDPKFTAEDLAKLRTYVEAGGMIFSTADGNSREFTEAMKKYVTQIVDGKYEVRQLPKTHTMFTKELWADIKNPPVMLGMSNGVRDIWIHSPADMGASWQQRKYATTDHFKIPANIFFYATGKGTLRSKLAPLVVQSSSESPVRTIEVALIDHAGNANPEPGAWPRMAKLARADFHSEIKTTLVKATQLDPRKYKIAHMTGSTRFTMSDADIAAIQAYLSGGGMLFADSAGGSSDFTESFLLLMKSLFPNTAPDALPPDHPIIKGTMTDGESAAAVEFRKYGNLKLHQRISKPQLDAITVNGRVVLIFSPFDVTSGFLGTNTWGIVGYAPESSETIARNILLYAQGEPASTQPASAPASTGPTTTEPVAATSPTTQKEPAP